jgi:hypothetical protein
MIAFTNVLSLSMDTLNSNGTTKAKASSAGDEIDEI